MYPFCPHSIGVRCAFGKGCKLDTAFRWLCPTASDSRSKLDDDYDKTLRVLQDHANLSVVNALAGVGTAHVVN